MGLFDWLFGRKNKERPKESLEENDTSSFPEEGDTISFYIRKSVKEELAECNVGDYVKLWRPTDYPSKVFIYRHDTSYGEGMIGLVATEYTKMIRSHIKKGLDIEAQIINLTSTKCEIKCRLFSKEETEERKYIAEQPQREKLKEELTKKYNPKKNITISVELPKKHKQVVGNQIFIKKQPMEHYLKNVSRLRIDFVNENGEEVASKSYEVPIIRNLLKAYFNDIPMSFTIISKDKKEPYRDYTSAKVEVEYQQKKA